MKQTVLFILLVCLYFNAFAQFQGCFPLGNDRCANAELINSCRLDGWSSTTDPAGFDYSWNGDVPRFGWCEGGFQIHNNQWIKFTAIEDHLTINIDVTNCQNSQGIQMAVYETVDPVTGECPGPIINCFGDGAQGMFDFEIENLNPEEEYLLMIDGAFGDGCPFTLDITSGIPPTLEVEATALAICPGVDAQGALSAEVSEGNIIFGWSTQNGHFVSGEFTLNPIIDQPGDYTFFAYNTITCCQGFTTVNVPATTVLPEAQASVINHINCANPTATLSAAGSEEDNGLNVFEYLWSFENGNPAGEGFELGGLIFPGIYILTVRNVSTGCTSDVTIEVFEDFEEPEISLLSPPVLNCVDTAIFLTVDAPIGSSFEWISIAGFSSNEQAPMITETGTYEVIVTGANGCTSTQSIEVTDDTDAPLLQVQTLVLDCTNPTAAIQVINDNEETTYAWSSDGFTSAEMSPEVSVTGTYTLIATNPNGCDNIYIVEVTEDMTPPEITIANEQILDCNLTEFAITSTSNSNIEGYIWTGPNGFTSTEASPMINLAGTYSLEVIDDKGCINTTDITIDDDLTPPEVSLDAIGTLTCDIKTVQLESTSTETITAYAWSNNLGEDANAEVTEAGNYTVTITGENGCTNEFDVNVTDNFLEPISNAGPDAQLTCALSETMLSASGTSQNGGDLSYQWTLNGNGISNDANVQISSIGTYELIVTDETNGCTAIDELVVSSNDDIPEVILEEFATLNCINNTIMLSGINSTSGQNITYQWLDENRNVIGNDATLEVSNSGTYTFMVFNTDNGCPSEQTVIVEENIETLDLGVDNIEQLNCLVTSFIVTADIINPAQTNVTYQWVNTDSGTMLGQSENLEILGAGNYNLIITNQENGCTSEFPFPVIENRNTPVADAGAPLTITCAENEATLNANATQGNNLTFQWIAPDGTTLAQEAITNTNQPGEYTLVVTDTESGCSDESKVIIDINADFPEIFVTAPTVLNCTQATTGLFAINSIGTGTLSFSWFDADRNLFSNEANIEVDNPGAYTLVLTDTDSDCSIEETFIVVEDFEPPMVDAGTPQIITCDINSVILDGSNSSSGSDYFYAWFNSNNVLLGNDELVSVENPGEYTLIVFNIINGCSNTATVMVTPDENIPVVEIANNGGLSCLQNQVDLFSTLDDNPNYEYTWQNESGQILSSTTSYSTTEPGVYTLQAIDLTNGCSNSMSIQVEENFAAPVLDADTPDLINCINSEVLISTQLGDNTQNVSYTWSDADQDNIGDEATLTVDAPGVYSLIATDVASGCSTSITVNIDSDFDILSPDAVVSNIIDCNVQQANLEAIGIDLAFYNYAWYDAQGNLLSEDKNFSTDLAGEYEVIVTNSQNGCVASARTEVFADLQAPVVNIPTADILNCQISEVQLIAETDLNQTYEYQWVDTQGNNISTTTTIEVSTPGEYQLIVINPANGCTSDATVVVEQNINNPQAIIDDLAPLGLSCEQRFILLDGNASTPVGNVKFEWYDQNGNLVSEEAIYEASSPGNYNLIITDLTTFCVSETNTLVSQNEDLPQVAIAPADILSCNISSIILDATQSDFGSAFVYTWSSTTGLANFDNTNILNPIVSSPGIFTLTVLNTDTGCENSYTVEVLGDFIEPIAQANAEDDLDCVITEVMLNSTGSSEGAQYSSSWIIDGLTLTNLDFVTVENAGTYMLVVTDLSNGCTSESFVTVAENLDRPTDATIAAGDITCNGFEDGFFQVNEIIGGTAPYQFTVNNQSFSNLPNIENLGPGNYPLFVTDAIGCTFETEITIEEPPQVFVQLGEDITINLGESAFLNASSNVDQIFWMSIDTLDCIEDCFIQEVNPFNTTTYEVEVMDENGCIAIDEIVVNVRFDRGVYIPNAFSPNDDGNNDFFRVFGNSSVLRVKNMLIANRWGEIVYEEEDINLADEQKFWNGTHRGELLNDNVLVYYVVVEYIDGRTESFKGDFTLLR